MSEFNVRGKKTSSFKGSRRKYPKRSITSVLWARKGGKAQEEAGKASWNELLHLGSSHPSALAPSFDTLLWSAHSVAQHGAGNAVGSRARYVAGFLGAQPKALGVGGPSFLLVLLCHLVTMWLLLLCVCGFV